VPDSGDVEAVHQLLALCEQHRVVPTMIQAGSVRIVIGGRVPSPAERRDPAVVEPYVAKPTQPLKDGERPSDEEMEELRRRSRETFGHVKSDEALIAMRGAL
jgi:hypothetical protein